MRRLARHALPAKAQKYLQKRRTAGVSGRNDVENQWKAARQTQTLMTVLQTLQTMTGPRQRCMYCVDSHGSDIDHFRPKSRYPRHAFKWRNMLLCCTECGRYKGSQFPMTGRRALLIDPTAEDPWQHIDFDPDTGNLVARFDLKAHDWSAKGSATAKVLRLDCREALANGHKATYLRLAEVVRRSLPALELGALEAPVLLAELRKVDDHGLLPWVFRGSGRQFVPFSGLFQNHPQVWDACSIEIA